MDTNDIIDRLIIDWKKERPDLNTSAMGIVGRILKILERRAGQALKESGLYYTDFDVLATLRRSGSPYQLTPKELMKSVIITSGAMTSLLDRLTKLELIYRKTDENDKRVKRAGLTAKGIDVIDKAVEKRFKEAEQSISELTNSNKKILADLLKETLIQLEK